MSTNNNALHTPPAGIPAAGTPAATPPPVRFQRTAPSPPAQSNPSINMALPVVVSASGVNGEALQRKIAEHKWTTLKEAYECANQRITQEQENGNAARRRYETFKTQNMAAIDSFEAQAQAELEQHKLEISNRYNPLIAEYEKAIADADEGFRQWHHKHKTTVLNPLNQQKATLLDHMERVRKYILRAETHLDTLDYNDAMNNTNRKAKWEDATDLRDVYGHHNITCYGDLKALAESDPKKLHPILVDLHMGKLDKSPALIEHWETLTEEDFTKHGVPVAEFKEKPKISNKPKDTTKIHLGRLAIYFGFDKDEV